MMGLSALGPTLLLASLGAGEPEFAIRLHHPAPAPTSDEARPGVGSGRGPERGIPYADAVPLPGGTPAPSGPGSDPGTLTPPPPTRKLGTNTTVFVNFDGVDIGECTPSNSHANCHWLAKNTTVDPWSGSFSQRVAILDAMRAIARDYGIRVTGQRPPADQPYVMVVYGGDSIEEEALGRAPAGDCWDDLPNQIAYVYLDGERQPWINGGASTAMHEASHTWGLDHIGLDGRMMAPTGGNSIAKPFPGCTRVVENLELEPGEASCPDLNLELCGLEDFQHADAILRRLFGQPYVDDQAPVMNLVRPFDGAYFQGPASFQVELQVIDDLHPQPYEFALRVPGLIDDPSFDLVLDPSFEVIDLPEGTWTFELRLRDAAGNEGMLAFEVEVGEDALVLDDGCACVAGPASTASSARLQSRSGPAALFMLGLVGFVRRRRSHSANARARKPGRAPALAHPQVAPFSSRR